jgi:chaperonin cofactor prefoldin
MKLPISFEQFNSNPIGAIAFIAVIAVGFLFYELRSSYNEQLHDQDIRIEKLEGKIETYENKLDELNKKLLECLNVRNN